MWPKWYSIEVTARNKQGSFAYSKSLHQPTDRPTLSAPYNLVSKSYLSKINPTSLLPVYLCITKLLKWSANCAQFLIHSGLSNEWTFAIPSTITTFIWPLFGPATLLLFLLLFTFSRMLIRLLLDEEWAPSAANNDLSKIQLTIENDYRKFVLAYSLLDIDLWPALAHHHHTCEKGPILLKLHNLVCCSHLHDLCTGFPC